jgi:peptidoglycan hydrolase-like protein with peptidoglycan-binding domain
MSLRDLINKLDSINVETRPATKQEQVVFSISEEVSVQNTLSTELMESFGILTEEQIIARELFLAEGLDPLSEAFTMDDAWAWAKGLGVGVLGAIKKIGIPITVAYEIYMAWEEIKRLPKDMPRNRFKSEVAKIITRAVGQTGLVWFGALVGGVVAGTIGLTTGPGAIILALAGAIGSAYAFGDDVDKMAGALVDFFYPSGKETAQPATTAPAGQAATPSGQSAAPTQAAPATPQTSTAQAPAAEPATASGNNLVSTIQTKLKSAGFDVGSHGIDGKFGPDTLAAFKEYKKANNLDGSADLDVFLQLAGIRLSESISDQMAFLKNRLAELEETQLDELRIRPAIRHGADTVGITTSGMGAVKELGTTVKIGTGRTAQTWSYDKQIGDYVSTTGARKSPTDMKAAKDQADAAVAAAKTQKQNAANLKSQPNDQIQYGAGSQRQTYTYTQNGWVDANGKVVKNSGIIADLEKANLAKRTGQAAKQQGATPSTSSPTPKAPKGGTSAAAPAASPKGRVAKSIDALKSSRFGRALSNPAVLTLIAAVATLGYLFNKDGNIFAAGPESEQGSGQGALPSSEPVTQGGKEQSDAADQTTKKDQRTPLEKWYGRF